MFDNISPRYDLLNHLLSLNIDKLWRKKAIKLLSASHPKSILDIATGTADFALEAARLKPGKITAIDISGGMLEIGREKIKRKNLSDIIELRQADSEAIPFEDNIYDAAIVAFGVRNFENLQKGLDEIFRVLNPGGIFIVLEFSQPRKIVFKQLYFFYFTRILPFLGRLVSKDMSAYSYLPQSVREFPEGEEFLAFLKKSGFDETVCYPQTMGIASIYKAQKPKK